jgi:glycerol kinase
MMHFGCRWIEHDPEEIWQGVELCIQRALQAAENKAGPIKVKALGITNQRETTLVWDKTTGKPLHNAIVWMDSRTESICKQIEEEHGSKVSHLHFSPSYIQLKCSGIKSFSSLVLS